MSRVLITGGAGFIGSNLTQQFITAGHEVLNLDNQPPRNPAAGGQFVRLNILDRAAFVDAVQAFDPQYFFHLAARTDLNGRSDDDYQVNIAGVSNAVAAAKAAPRLRRAVFASSMYVCKLGYVPRRDDEYCPHTAYGHSKELGEQIVRREAGDAFCWAIVRPTSIWGPWFHVPYLQFFHTVRRGHYFHPRGQRIRRSYGFVFNTVQQLSDLAEHANADKIHAKVFYLADYEPLDILHWAQTIADAFGAGKVRELPLMVMRMGARFGDCLRLLGMANPPLSTFRLNNLLTSAIYDLSPIRQVSGDQGYTLEEGVRITVDWMRRHILQSPTHLKSEHLAGRSVGHQ